MRWVQRLVPLAIGLPVGAGLLLALVHLTSTRHPFLSWSNVIATDSKAIALGKVPYGNARSGYTGMFYTPLYPMIVAPFYRVYWWDGWPVVVTVISSIVLSVTAGALAVGRRGGDTLERTGDIAAGVGVGGLSWWLVSTNPNNALFDASSDQIAVMFALVGLVALGVIVAHRSTRTWPAVVLLSAAFWAKQTMSVSVIVAVLALVWWAIRGVVTRRTALRFVMTLLVSNLVVLGLLQLVSHGWAWFFIVEMPSRTVQSEPGRFVYVRELRNLLFLPAFLVALGSMQWLAPRSGRRSGPGQWIRSVGDDARSAIRRPADLLTRPAPSVPAALVLLLSLFLVCALPVSFVARRKTGGNPNQYICLLWAMAFLFAVGYGAARRTRLGAAASTTAVVILVASLHVGVLRSFVEQRGIALPTSYPAEHFSAAPYARHKAGLPDLYVYARSHRVYHPVAGDLNAESFHEVWPAQPDLVDLLAAGQHPDYLVDALLDRRFDAIAPFVRDSPFLLSDAYVSAFGRTEDNFLWKLNRVIASGYTANAPGVPVGFLGRRAGSTPEPWLRTCFGPFRIGNAQWDIRAGGGLWCLAAGSNVLRLEQTPARVTEVRTAKAVGAHGEIVVALRGHAGNVDVRFGNGVNGTDVRIETGTSSSALVVRVRRGAKGPTTSYAVGAATFDGGPAVTLVLGGDGVGRQQVAVPVDAGFSGVVDVHATANSRAAIDLSNFTTT